MSALPTGMVIKELVCSYEDYAQVHVFFARQAQAKQAKTRLSRALRRHEGRAAALGLDGTAHTLREARLGRSHEGWLRHMVQHCSNRLSGGTTWPLERSMLRQARFLFRLAADAMAKAAV